MVDCRRLAASQAANLVIWSRFRYTAKEASLLQVLIQDLRYGKSLCAQPQYCNIEADRFGSFSKKHSDQGVSRKRQLKPPERPDAQ